MSSYLYGLINRYPSLKVCEVAISEAFEEMKKTFRHGGKVLICGNGGSASDGDHIVGELMKSFCTPRGLNAELHSKLLAVSRERGAYLAGKLEQGLPAISLNAHSGLISAIANDIDSNLVYAQQVTAYGKKEDVLLGISTSGNSQNVCDALITAKAFGLRTIALTGETGGKLKEIADILINVPSSDTATIQELHLPVYHCLCLMVESFFFPASR